MIDRRSILLACTASLFPPARAQTAGTASVVSGFPAGGMGDHIARPLAGEVVIRADAVASALERALASGLPAVLDCRTRFVPHPSMPVFGSMNRYGFDALTRVGETQ